MRRVWPAIAAVALALTSAGCASSAEKPSTYPTEALSPSATPRMPDTADLPTVPPGYIDEDTDTPIVPAPVATWSDDARAAVIAAGVDAMTAFTRPGTDRRTWWDTLSPLLTPQARADYAYVSPETIPASRVIGNGVITDDTSAMVAHVEVPTDVGVYTVVLTRYDGSSPWLAARFTPPEGVR